jgi:hypothetical protein
VIHENSWDSLTEVKEKEFKAGLTGDILPFAAIVNQEKSQPDRSAPQNVSSTSANAPT